MCESITHQQIRAFNMSNTVNQENLFRLAGQIAELQAENERLKQENRQIIEALVFAGYEWRNHLTLLTLASDKLRRERPDCLTAPQILALERIWDGLTAMRRVANSYFSLAQVKDTVFKVQPSFINVKHDVLLPVRALYKDLLARRKQKCEIEAGKTDMLIWADHKLLTSVCENLLSIAIEHGRPGNRIVLSVVERGIEDEFAIRCRGTAISPERLDELLGFFTSDARQLPNGNSDIGLYLAWKIIKAHGGRLWADARTEKWMSFNFTLPKHRATR